MSTATEVLHRVESEINRLDNRLEETRRDQQL